MKKKPKTRFKNKRGTVSRKYLIKGDGKKNRRANQIRNRTLRITEEKSK